MVAYCCIEPLLSLSFDLTDGAIRKCADATVMGDWAPRMWERKRTWPGVFDVSPLSGGLGRSGKLPLSGPQVR